MKFDAPIPGQSLTKELGGAPWEQPPLLNTEEEVLEFYLKKLNDEESIDELMFLLERKMPLETFVDSMTSVGVMEGYHSFDMKMIVSPKIHEYIKSLAEASDVDFIEFAGPSKDERMATRDKERMKILITEALEKGDPMIGEDSQIMEQPPVSPVPTAQAPTPEQAPAKSAGLIPRRM